MPQFASKTVAPEQLTEPRYFGFLDGKLVIGPNDGPGHPLTPTATLLCGANIDCQHYLGQLDGADCFALGFTPGARLADGFSTIRLRQVLGQLDEELFYLAGRAQQIINWDRNTRHCGACGGPTRMRDDRSKFCDECAIPFYPQLSPSIIVLVTKGEQMLLARNVAWGPNGFYSTLAGFVEPGESVEETVHREVFEEVGVRVKNLKYLGSQSWPFPNALMLGYHAQYAGGASSDETVFHYHDEEIADARWFDIDDLPKIPGRIAISRWLIDAFIEQVRGRR